MNTDEFKKGTNYRVTALGHSLWSVDQLLAQEVNFSTRVYQDFFFSDYYYLS